MPVSQTVNPLLRPSFDKELKLLLVVASFYKDIADKLVEGAQLELESAGAIHDVLEVPGALEVPTAISIADHCSDFDGYVALGCVIRGETTHYETVCDNSNRAIQLLGLQGLCIGNGILTVENHGQAEVRADPKGHNKGGAAAIAALHLISVAQQLRTKNEEIGFKPTGTVGPLDG